MTFTVRYETGGRFGNTVFTYTLCVMYQLLGYKYIIDKEVDDEIYITDDNFLQLYNEEMFKNKTLPVFNKNIVFSGYCQHDYILRYCKLDVINFIKNNESQQLRTEMSIGKVYESKVLVDDYLPDINLTDDDLVVHLRLEDNIIDEIKHNSPKFILSPHDYNKLLENIKFKKIYWVMAKPTHPIEVRYLDYMINKWGGEYKERTVEEDVCLMRKAKKIICSRSTLSWISSAYSISEQEVYLPNCYETWNLESFNKVHDNTTRYDYKKCTLQDLENIFNNEV